MSKHDKLYIEKFQPREKSDTPVMDFLYDTLGFKEKRRKRFQRKRKIRNRFQGW